MGRYVVPVIAVLLLAIAFFEFRGEDGPAMEAAATAEQPRYVLRGAQWSSFDEQGALRFQGSAANIDYFDDESARMHTFSLEVFGAEGAPWTATAPQGYSPPGGRERVQLLGGVEGKGRWPDGEPMVFRTPQLWVDTRAETITTDDRVDLESKSRTASSRGLKVTGPKQQMSLLNEVEMRYVPQ